MTQLTETDFFSLAIAISSDEKKAERLTEIRAAEKAEDEAKAASAKLLAEANEVRSEAMRIAALNETERQNLAGKQAELEKFEQTLSDHNQMLIAEKAAWEKIRQEVDTEQKTTDAQLAKWHEQLVEREAAVHDREVAIDAREQAAAGLAAESAMRISRLRDALHAVDPPPPEEPTKDAA